MYIVTSCVESGITPWTYVLDNALTNTKKLKVDIDTSYLPEELKNTSWRNAPEKIAFAKKIKPFLKQISDTTRRKLVEQIICSLNDVELPQNQMMNWKQINEIKTAGTLIGSHSVSHPLLAKIEDENEIELGKKLLN